ncbi:MAG: helix-turn-helix transcriptional regulator [Sphingosinicella sp.]|nr:helix-turn-helix transcriptional regulator [Sphingosinicella sp.]
MAKHRAAEPGVREEEDVGQYIRQLRRRQKMNLMTLSERTGLSISTLSKIENNQIELTYAKLMLISDGLGVNLSELIFTGDRRPVPERHSGRRSITPREGRKGATTSNYEYGYLNTDLAKKSMVPVVARVKQSELSAFGPLAVHPGEELIYVLSGAVIVHTEDYEPTVLRAGDSMYFDASMPHAVLNQDADEEAEIIFINTPNIQSLAPPSSGDE